MYKSQAVKTLEALTNRVIEAQTKGERAAAFPITRSQVLSFKKYIGNTNTDVKERDAVFNRLNQLCCDPANQLLLTLDENLHTLGMDWFKHNIGKWEVTLKRGRAREIPDANFVAAVRKAVDGNFARFYFGGLQGLWTPQGGRMGWRQTRPIWGVVPLVGEPWEYTYGSWQSGTAIEFEPDIYYNG